ncbi:MAG TPA: hypothetical protein VK284_14140 [Streptosporangiaceae bacterium]|nr:hypothetical protein [Streptosporangiaceae bacterium]
MPVANRSIYNTEHVPGLPRPKIEAVRAQTTAGLEAARAQVRL